MTNDLLSEFVDRVNSDDAFRELARTDPATALAACDLGAAASCASEGDEDRLRRLTARTAPDTMWWSKVKRFFSRLFCGSGKTRSWECTRAPQ